MRTFLFLSVLAGASGLAGCVSHPVAEVPTEARGVALNPVSSSVVTVKEPMLRKRGEQIELLGAVTKIYGSASTKGTHLDVSFLRADGELVRRQITAFSPPQLARDRHAPNRQGWYSIVMDALPEGTARIEVRAHDAPVHAL